MRSLADPSLNCITPPEPSVPRRLIKRKKPHYRGSKSGLPGVIHSPKQCASKPWKAYLRCQGQYITIGYFATKEEAAKAYNDRALKLFGEGTFLNPLD